MKQILRLPMQYFAEEKPEEPEEQKPKEQEKAADGKTFTQEDVNAIVAREVKKALKRAGQGQQARQQEAVVHLLPAGPPGRKCGVPGLPAQTPSQPSKPAYRSGTEADPEYAPPQSAAWPGGVVVPPEAEHYTRRPESLFRVMRRLGMFPQKKEKAYTPKPYQQMLTREKGARWM